MRAGAYTPAVETNLLFYGDNLGILRTHIPAESVDLVYLDPPFNSNRTYSAIFADESGRKSDAQIQAFDDSWHWGPTAEGHLSYLKNSALHQGAVPVGVSQLLAALEFGIGKNPMLAYLVEMTVRLVELHRVLKPTGSLWLHCDPTASHYLKIVLDAIFGAENYRNEVIWKRTSAHSDAKQGGNRLGRVHDVLLFYSKGDENAWNVQYEPYSDEHVAAKYRTTEPNTGRLYTDSDLTANKPGGDTSYEWKGVRPPKGRFWAYSKANMEEFERAGRLIYTRTGFPRYKRYLDEMSGVSLQDVWSDIPPVNAMARERLGWDTQKPLALLERVLMLSSNPGDVVLDPFCGCGTALIAAQKLGRRWIGIDITYLAVAVMRRRMLDSFPALGDIPVVGKPTEVEGARMLANQGLEGRYQFQWWAVDEIGAQPASGDHKKGADTGIDGRITFTGGDGSLQQALVSVKSGKPKSDDVKVLRGVIEREGAAIGILVMLDEPTKPMQYEATVAGTYHSDVSGKDYPKIQILSVADLVERGKRPLLPPLVSAPFARAPKVVAPADQGTLFDQPR
jgi:DNA modification methylase